jgi:lipopolysaccharide/colanic/teichoic acid biosynthesis glycosyltransferase
MYKLFFKPFLDFIIALLAVVVLSPVLLVLMLVLAVVNKGKPFFTQARPGKNGRIFYIVKFKTMNEKRDGAGKLLPDIKRITKAGKFVRKFSLDELPQLINVIKGEMSLIGPRPLLPEYLELYDSFQVRRHEIKPGITGWAQVNGRNAISWSQKFELDVVYVDMLSFRLDIKIIFRTILKVIKSENINASIGSTTHQFRGSKIEEKKQI